MRRFLAAPAALLALGATLAAAPADARWYGGYGGGYYHHHGGRAGLAIGAGILGLAAGAAIASRPRYYSPGYGYAPVYAGAYPGYGYAPPPPPPPPAYAYGPCSRWAYWHGYC